MQKVNSMTWTNAFAVFLLLSLPASAQDKTDTAFTQALAEAKRLVDTNEGKAYDGEFAKVVAPRFSEIVSECTKNLGPKIIFEVVFIFAADGGVQQVLTPGDQPAAECVGEKLRDLHLPAPPRVGWPVQLSVNISPDNAPAVRALDAKFAADNLKYSRDFYSKVHFVAIANLDFGRDETVDFKYDRYPNGGPERIQTGDGEFARKDGKTWLRSDDWGETGKPVDAQTAKRLNNWISLIDARLNGEPASNDPSEGATVIKSIGKQDKGEREEFVFEESKEKPKEKSFPHISFGRYKNAKDEQVLLSEFSGPMVLGTREAKVKITFSHLVAVQMTETTDESPSPVSSAPSAQSGRVLTDHPSDLTLPDGTVIHRWNPPSSAAPSPKSKDAAGLLDGKLKIDIPPDFVREPNDPKEPKSVAKFVHKDEGGAWGEVLRGTHGLTPDKLEGYLKMRVAEYSKGFKWLPKDAHLQWLKKEIVTIDGRKWADWRYVPLLKGKKDYRNSPVYTRFLTTSYQGQLLEITFTSNLNTEPALKEEIDHIMDSVHVEE
jgi:hypothetical protein